MSSLRRSLALIDASPTSPASPTTTNTPDGYITVAAYQWPKPTPVKRRRLDEEERKRRHREGQRQFMSRKQRRVLMLRRELALLQWQRKWLRAVHEEQMLQNERGRLLKIQVIGSTPRGECSYPVAQREKETFTGPADAEVMDSSEMETLLIEVLLSW